MSSECPTCGGSFTSETAMKSHHKQKHGVSLAGFTHTCVECGREFQSEVSEREFCSMECLHEYQKDRKTEECEVCGRNFDVIKSRSPTCCSRECSDKYKSREYSGTDSHRWKGKTERDCSVCGDTMYLSEWELDRRVVCSRECYKEYLSEEYSGEDSWHWKDETQDNYGHEWDEIAENIREKYDSKCQVCNDENELRAIPVHHIIPSRTFEDEKDAHFEENLVPVCDSCHGEVEWVWGIEKQIEEFNRDPDQFDV